MYNTALKEKDLGEIMAKYIELNASNFDSTVSEGVALVDFWAPWCGPCRMIGPIVSQLSDDYKGKAIIGKLNVDDNPEVAMKYGVRSIPTIAILKDGELVDKHIGLTSKKVLEDKIKAHL